MTNDRRRSRPRTLAAALVAASLAVAACSSDDDGATATNTGSGDGQAASSTSVEPTAPVTEPSEPEPAATEPAATEPAATEPAATEPAATDPAETAPTDPYLVSTELGEVRGGASAVEGVRNFLAIPYAAPPVGDNAWRAPQPREPWSEPFDATAGGASCPQSTEGITAAFIITPDPDPDCLTVSVWSPDTADGLPVMVWFHGGGFTNGSAHSPYYNGDDLAANDVVVVNVNYRLGAQGFLATEQLRAEADGAAGNYGLLDQQAALRWVQDNIDEFGGDADRVTIFGESAGGFAVCGHMASPDSAGLFAQAIIQSGGGCDRLVDLDTALASGAALLEQLGCTDMACMRSTTDADIIAAADAGGFNAALVADGVVLSESALDQARAGELGDIPVLIGSNADEATLFTIGLEEPDDATLLEFASSFTDAPEDLVGLYPPGEFESNLARYQAMSTDATFTCPTIAFAEAFGDAFVYHYTYVSPDNPLGLGATHGAEIAGLFAHADGLAIEVAESEESTQISDSIQTAWAAFATEADPGEEFEPYGDDGTVTLLDVPVERVDSIRNDRCAWVNELRR